jgi:hypothetical protein
MYWYLDLKDWLHEEGSTHSTARPCFFCKVFPDVSYVVKFIIYVDNKLSLETMNLPFRNLRTSCLRDLMWSS